MPTLPDLSACEREPLAFLGLVQPHGGVMVLDHGVRRILAASAGIAALLDLLTEPAPGEAADRYFEPEFLAGLATLPPGAPPCRVASAERSLECFAHRSADGVVVEWVLPTEAASDGVVSAVQAAARQELEVALAAAPPNLFSAAQLLADGVARLAGYHRVLVYRFHPDWSGEVIAERRRPGMTPYLGLRYPASDIPAQARALYRRVKLRVVADAQDVPARLIHAGQRPPDLGQALLRSVSSFHIEYLRNMGVRATLTASLMHDGALWGLLACHHDLPRLPAEAPRQHVVALADAFGALIGRAERAGEARRAQSVAALRHRVLAESDAAGETRLARLMLEAGTAEPGDLAASCGADGIAYVDDDAVVALGLAPDPARLRQLAAGTGEEVTAVTQLPAAGAAPGRLEAAGMLAARLPGGGWLGLFRRELAHAIHWGGDPAKPAEAGIGGRPSPRRSFALWREEVRGTSRPWGEEEHALLSAAVALLGDGTRRRAQARHLLAELLPEAGLTTRGLAARLAPRFPAALLDGGGEDARLVEVTRPLATLLGASGLALRGKPWEEAAPLLGLAPVRDAQADGDLSGGVLHSACSPEYGPLFLRLERRPALQIEAPDAALHLDLVLANDGTREGRLAEALGAAGHQMGQVRRSRDAFLRTTSHELRAPLAGIIGLARMLQEPGVAASAEEVRQHAAEIARAGEDMLALVENLLAVALVEAERLVPRREEVDLAGLLRRQAQLLAPLFAGRMVHLSLSLPDAAKGATDARLVGSAVLNLLSNALKFTPPGGEVGCALSIAAGVAEIRVTDTGPGIRAGDRARVFAAFEQAGSSAGGAGLGLFIARNMAEALGGSLSLDPARTRGAGFVLRIPVYDEPGEGPELR